VLLLAKHPAALINLLSQFKERQVSKEYLCLVHGKVQPPEATLNIPLGRASRDRKLFSAQPDGRPAITQYKVAQLFTDLKVPELYEDLQKSQGRGVPLELAKLSLAGLKKRLSVYQGFSLVQCWPKTGRTHQIRVHMAQIQHPLVRDQTYVGKKRKILDPLWCSRQFLHAASISFEQPRTKKKLTLTAKLPDDLIKTLNYLES